MKSRSFRVIWALAPAAATVTAGCANFTTEPAGTTSSSSSTSSSGSSGGGGAGGAGGATGGGGAGGAGGAQPSFCETETKDFCDDFDTGRPSRAWFATQAMRGGQLLTDTLLASSPPWSMHVSVPAVLAGGLPASAQLTCVVAEAGTTRLKFDALLPAAGAVEGTTSLAALVLDADSFLTLDLGPTAHTVRLIDGTPPVVTVLGPLSTPIPEGRWVNVFFVLNRTTNTVRVELDLVEVFAEPNVAIAIDGMVASAGAVVGLAQASIPASARGAYIDNVTFDVVTPNL